MITLNYRDARPIYEQVKDGLRRLIISGAVEEGEKLPSVRSLAATLAINPNTIQRAYEALEQEGYVRSEPGKGSFARGVAQRENPRKEQLMEQLDEVCAELRFMGVTTEELVKRIQEEVSK